MLLNATSQAQHPFNQRAARVFANAKAGGASLEDITHPPSDQSVLPQTQSQPLPPGQETFADDQDYPDDIVPANALRCYYCSVTWHYENTDKSLIMAKDERAAHMSALHDSMASASLKTQWTEINVTADNNHDQLTPGRWLPFPSSAAHLCRKLPLKISPVNTTLDLQLVGLPVINKSVITKLHDRTDRSLKLRNFTTSKLLEHENYKRRKLNIDNRDIVLDDTDPDIQDGFEAFTSVLNYLVLSNFVDTCDKSPFALLYVVSFSFSYPSLLPFPHIFQCNFGPMLKYFVSLLTFLFLLGMGEIFYERAQPCRG